jgi:glutamyl-tRNA(Gln) amidotransferase subunit E
MKDLKLNDELANQIARSPNMPLFENIIKQVPDANLVMVVRTLETTLDELAKDGVPVDNIKEEHLIPLFRLHSEGKIPNEAVPGVLKIIAGKPGTSVDDAVRSLGVGVETGELEAVIDRVIEERMDFIKEKGINSAGPLMGIVMKELRGKVSGQEISRVLNEKISAITG